MDNDVDELKKEITLLRERMAILEYRMERMVAPFVPVQPFTAPMIGEPYIVTCGVTTTNTTTGRQ